MNFFCVIFTVIFPIGMVLGDNTLVPDTCLKISNDDPKVSPGFCEAAFGSDPGSSTATTLTQLGSISFRLDLSNATSISSTIDGLLNDPGLDPDSKQALESCSDLYSGARVDLEVGLEGFNGGDYETASARASGVLSAPTEEGFKEGKGEESPLTKENRVMAQLVAITLGVIKLIHEGVHVAC